MSVETFRKHWFLDRVTSSLGYVVTVKRDRVEVADAGGVIAIDAEWAPGRGTAMLLFPSSIPDEADRPRREVVARVERAFAAAGWTVKIHS